MAGQMHESQARHKENGKRRQGKRRLEGLTSEDSELLEKLRRQATASSPESHAHQVNLPGSPPLQNAQRVSLAAQVSRLHGNAHLLRVLVKTPASRAVSNPTGINLGVIQREGEEGNSTGELETSTPEGGGSGEVSVSEAIQTALNQYQQMPIDVPAQDPRQSSQEAPEPGEATQVLVRVPYFINTGDRLRRAERARARSRGVRSAISGIPLETRVGKGSPAQTRAAVQSMVDRGLIRGAGDGWPPTAEDIRAFMQTYGIGVDCSGFIYWALWQVQASRGGEAAAETWASGFRSGGRMVRGYAGTLLTGATRIRAPSELAPGDIAAHRPSSGTAHYRIVMEASTQGEYFIYALAESAGSKEGPNVRRFRAPVDAEDFSSIEQEEEGEWNPASALEKRFQYYRRAETAPPAPAEEAAEPTAEGQAEEELLPPPGGSLPPVEAVYGGS